jgi:hypothetical protein
MKQAKIYTPTRIRPEVLEKLREVAKKENRSLNNIIETAIMRGINFKL